MDTHLCEACSQDVVNFKSDCRKNKDNCQSDLEDVMIDQRCKQIEEEDLEGLSEID